MTAVFSPVALKPPYENISQTVKMTKDGFKLSLLRLVLAEPPRLVESLAINRPAAWIVIYRSLLS